MKLRESIGEVIREFRTERGLTMRQLADETPMALGYLSEVERGHKEASSEVLAKIADALDVPLAEIVVVAGFRLGGYDDNTSLDRLAEPALIGR